MHLQPARMSSLQMSFLSTKGQSDGEAAHLVGLRTSRAFLLQEGASEQGSVGPASTWTKFPLLWSLGCRQV